MNNIIKKTFTRHIITVLCLVLFTFSAHAQNYAGDEKPDTIRDIIVTGQFRPQSTDQSIYKMDVLGLKEIKLKAANNLAELLKTEPGFQMSATDYWGDFIRFRGLTGEHVKILIDGMPITGRVGDRIDLGQISLYNIDRVEIIEGPMSVVFGSNALAGVVNLITRDYPRRAMAQINTHYESIGTYNINGLFAHRLQKNNLISVTAARNFFSGWGPIDTSRYKLFKPKLQFMTGVKFNHSGNSMKVAVNSDYLHEELRDPGALTLANYYSQPLDGYHFTSRWNTRMNFSNTFSRDFVVNLQAGYSYYRKRKITWVNDLSILKKTLAPDENLHDTTTFNLISARGFVSNITGRKFEYQTGFDASYETAAGKRTEGMKEMTDIAGFINFIVKPFNRISIQPGIRFIYNSGFTAPAVYSMNFKYDTESLIVRASYAKGFQAPTLRQLYLRFIDTNHEILGNPDLKSEKGNNLSLSVNYSITKDLNSWGIELNGYYNAIENAIQLALRYDKPGTGKYFNVQGTRFKSTGADLQIFYRRSKGFSIEAGVSHLGRLRLDNSEEFEWSTDFTLTSSYRISKPDIQIAVFYKKIDSYFDFAGNFNEAGDVTGVSQQYTSGYQLMDLTATKRFFDDRLALSAGLKNIFNVTIVNSRGNINIHGSMDNSSPVGYGRTVFFTASFTFEKP